MNQEPLPIYDPDGCEIIDHQRVPGDEGVVYLTWDGTLFSIVVNGRQLMDTDDHSSEDALANLACDRLADLEGAHILVGGLGMGFTLAAALKRVGAEGTVTVAELMASVVRWNREYVGEPSGHPLRDPRARVIVGDVGAVMEDSEARWDAILLDVDKGPDPLTHPENGLLYSREGLKAAHAALRPGGILAIWSVGSDSKFTGRLRKTGFTVELVRHEDERHAEEDPRDQHVIWLARKAG